MMMIMIMIVNKVDPFKMVILLLSADEFEVEENKI